MDIIKKEGYIFCKRCKLFLCKVLCEESIAGDGPYELKLWPKKRSDGLIYDSLVDYEQDTSIYVIHNETILVIKY